MHPCLSGIELSARLILRFHGPGAATHQTPGPLQGEFGNLQICPGSGKLRELFRNVELQKHLACLNLRAGRKSNFDNTALQFISQRR